jgi:predicted ATPase
VTFLFTDVEGSTRLLHELGAAGYADALAEHRRVLRRAFGAHGGVEVDTQGDAFFVAFPTAPGALAAAADALAGLEQGPIRVRMGVHTGTPHVGEEGYVGADVHRAARIAAAGHGGQVLVSAATAALLGRDGLHDLGEHRLKDLSAPERIFQLGEKEFPPLASLHQTNLPVPATPFLGRERELAEVLGLLSREDVRLLTLTGPGGTGKTRLGLQAVGAVADRYPHGVWWVPLALLRDPELVLEAAAQALGAQDGLAAHIGDKRLLVLFDNFEHVVDAAGGLAELLAACPGLDLVVTSREPLHLTGEQEYPVPPLAPEEGVGFFAARARTVQPEFQVDAAVAEICRRLDELPLALELAAARVKALSSKQILERLERRLPLLTGGARDLPERQRTLRATIEWSHELLTPDEQRLFARLGVFSGGATLDAAEQIVNADIDTLQSLVDKSLVRSSGGRYWMLETIREYAVERLEESGEAEELRRSHAAHFLTLAEEAVPNLRGDPQEWLERLDAEHGNLRAALDSLESSGETQLVLRMAGALTDFWTMRGQVEEGRRRLETALAADEHSTLFRARALIAASDFAAFAGDDETARRRAEEAVTLSSLLEDDLTSAHARYTLGNALTAKRQWKAAKQLFEESVRAFDELGDDFHALSARRGLTWMHEELGDFERARELTEQNLGLARSLGNRRIEARALGALSTIALGEGRIDDALALLTDSYTIDRELGFSIFVGIDLIRFAAILTAYGRAADGARLVARADTLREESGFILESWATEEREATIGNIRAALDETAFTEAYEEGRSLTVDEAVALALT